MSIDSPVRGGVPVAVYIAADDPRVRELLADYCTQYATARDWSVTATVTDTDRRQPPPERPGWGRIGELIGERAVAGVVTYSPGMLAMDRTGFEALRRLVGDRGAFLAVCRSHRPAGDAARRHLITDAAAGWTTP
jgi:hypothetical protein